MNTYKVTFVNNWNPYETQRGTEQAESIDDLLQMFADTNATVIEVEPTIDAEYTDALLAAYDEPRDERYPASPFYQPEYCPICQRSRYAHPSGINCTKKPLRADEYVKLATKNGELKFS